MDRNYILIEQQAALRIRRMALQILEDNTDADRLVLAGVAPNGSILAQTLRMHLETLFGGRIDMAEIHLDKRHPGEVTLQPASDLSGAVVIVVDDVANSGRTLTYALKPLLEQHPAKIQTLVLVDRTHKKFPIHPDYVGFSLATTLQEYIDVEVVAGEIRGAWIE